MLSAISLPRLLDLQGVLEGLWSNMAALSMFFPLTLAMLLLCSFLRFSRVKSKIVSDTNNDVVNAAGNTLVLRHFDHHSYQVNDVLYPGVRTFYRKHEHASKLPVLPLLVFIHGQEGSIMEYGPLLQHVTNVAPCLAIDLPGVGTCSTPGVSVELAAAAELTCVIIERYRLVDQPVVFIGHSSGCHLATLLAYKERNFSVLGLALIECSTSDVKVDAKSSDWLRTIGLCRSKADKLFTAISNNPVVASMRDLLHTTRRAVSEQKVALVAAIEMEDAHIGTKNENAQPMSLSSKTRNYDNLKHVWNQLQLPVLHITGEPELGRGQRTTTTSRLAVSTYFLPCLPPHRLPIDPASTRALSGILQTFLATEIEPALSAAWQLQHLAEARWSLKNLAKWTATPPTSTPIGGIFRAIKTLRQTDLIHCPAAFAAAYPDVAAVLDLSSAEPAYDSASLAPAGVAYAKLPVVSKCVPELREVDAFIARVDVLRAEVCRGHSPKFIAVHCMYGYNRTGYFIVSYLVRREGWALQTALDAFGEARGPGIRHEHFVDALFAQHHDAIRASPR